MTTSAQHTPGPWTVETTDLYGAYLILEAAQRHEYPADDDAADAVAAEDDANARLIAAAPDLLAALRELVDACAHCEGGRYFTKGGRRETCDACSGARAAIRKATEEGS